MDQTRLDGDMVATAYTVVMDLNYLDMAAVCFTDISPDVAALCFNKIRTQNTRHAGDSDRREHMQPSHPCESRPWSLDSLQTAIACLTYDDNDATFKACPGQWTPLLCSDYLHAIRSGDFDLGVKKRYDRPCIPPRDVPSLLLSEFSSWMERFRRSDIRLGADLCISIATGMAVIASPSSPLGWEARGVALHCLLECLPHPNSPEYNPADDGVTFRAIAHHANNALLHFADALRKVNSGLEDDSELVLSAAARVCGNLRRFESLPEYGEAAGFPPPQFMEAMHDYLALWESREPDRLSKRPLFHQLRFRAMQKQVDAYRRGDRQRPFPAETSGDADSVDDLLRVCLQEWNLGNIEPGDGQLHAAAISRLTAIPETVPADGGLDGAYASSLS
ncbi:hypothetical protein K466DRAFT_564887 [Polyporus arcularius HHB13444]|uniref:Uncharacterized protein n=1 Tax=Polyporus arcularius HHB13444 TaxID=1314778 RepID=A0A5C3PGT7_9APHY|nr:hypothetical protein K466DRAFT_564887 [Polyporus arcularius HHB13444]